MKYNKIKRILRNQVENNVQALWNFDEENKEFIYVFKRYNDELQIYTPQQLLDKLENYEREKTQ